MLTKLQPDIAARERSQDIQAELLSITHTDQKVNDESSIFHRCHYIDHSIVAIVTGDRAHYCGFRMRFLPPAISELLVLYLAVVLPFYRSLVPGDAYCVSPYLFAHPGGTWHTARFEKILRRETKKRTGVEMGLTGVNEVIKQLQAAIGNKVGA